MEEDVKKEYELAYLAKDESGSDLVRAAIAREGGEVFSEAPAERIALAYKIGKEAQAYFGWFHFRMAPEALKALDHELKTKSGVLRFLVVTPPFVKVRPRFAPKPKQGPVAVTESAPARPVPQAPLSNEALERKIEEILQE